MALLFYLYFLNIFSTAARADLSFIQISQAQSNRGKHGLFGKSWVEIQDDRMRMVSGYARKLENGRRVRDPRNVVQILNVTDKIRYLVHADKKSYAKAPLRNLDYGNRLQGLLSKGRPHWAVADYEITLNKRPNKRRMMGVNARHYHIRAKITLKSRYSARRVVRMDQHVWVAPISGKLSKALMSLIAFENSYRSATGGSLSPLDHERYQVREAAAFLQIPPDELRPVVEAVRERFRDLPSYPIASSVLWFPGKDPAAAVSLADIRPKKPQGPPGRRLGKPAPKPIVARPKAKKKPRRRKSSKPRFNVINWREEEKRINRQYRRSRGGFLGSLRARRVGEPPRQVFPRFEEELKKILVELLEEERQEIDALFGTDSEGPFYEIYSELHTLEDDHDFPASDFELPDDFVEIPYTASRR